MGRHKGADQKKVKKIEKAISKSKDGLWAMEISRRTKMPKSTVQRYLTHYMKRDLVEVMCFSGLIRVYKLREAKGD